MRAQATNKLYKSCAKHRIHDTDVRSPLLRIPSTADIAPLRRRSTHPGRCWLMLAPRDMRLTAAGHTRGRVAHSLTLPHNASKALHLFADAAGFRQQCRNVAGSAQSREGAATNAPAGRARHWHEEAEPGTHGKMPSNALYSGSFFYSYWASSAEQCHKVTLRISSR